MKKRIVWLLLAAMLMTIMVCGAAQGDGLTFDELGQKEADKLTGPGEYEITLSVPGAFDSTAYNEMIVMVDASLSQSGNFGKLKELLIGLGEQVLSDDGSMRLTLMGFGVGPRRAGSFYSVEQLKDFLATAAQDDLLQERSATNCEVGFEYVDQYIRNSSNLKNAVVVYTSDGGANADQTPMDWSKWGDETVFDYFRSFTKAQIIGYIVGTELDHIYAGNQPISATAAMFREASAAVEVAKKIHGSGSEQHAAAVDALYEEMNAAGAAYVDTVLQHIFAESSMAWGKDYPVATVEKAFQTYFRGYPGLNDEAYGSYMDLFYLVFGDTGYNKMPNRYSRAAQASMNLQSNGKVSKLYHVGYSGASNSWMNPEKGSYEGQEISKLTYIYNTDFASVVDDMVSEGATVVTTAYKDVTVTDPMSKWVTLDESSIRIYNGETKIYENGTWLTGDQPTANPITITTNADGRREITWKIKDGYLLHTDRYNLRYIVNVDETAEGFEWGKEYPANDPTDVTYTDPDGNEHTEPIDVPEVREDKPAEDFEEGDMGIRLIKEDLETGKPISDIKFDVYRVEPAEGEVLSEIPTEEEISRYAVEANKAADLITDANGYASAKLAEGLYMLVERESSKIKAPVAPFYVRLPMVNPQTHELMNVAEVNPKNELVPENPDIPDPEIPEDTTPKPDADFTIDKMSSVSDVHLSGAQFQVLRFANEGENGTVYTYDGNSIELVPVMKDNAPLVLTTGENGKATSPKLQAGLYFLLEVKAPAGFHISDELVAVYAASGESADNVVVVENTPGTLLPETGGMGTALFTAAGSLLCLIACVLLIRRKLTA